MAFDFSTLVTDRTQQDVAYVKQLVEKLVTGTATDEEKAEWNSFTLKGAYNHTDFNRVTEAMRYLVSRLRSYGYAVNFSEIALPRSDYTLDVVLKPLVIESGADYDSYLFEATGTGNFLCSVISGTISDSESVEVLEDKDYTVDLSKPKLWLYNKGDEHVSVTGGWESIPLGYEQEYNTPVAPAITRNETNMIITQSTSDLLLWQCGMVKTVNKIPMVDATKVCFSLKASSPTASQILKIHAAPSIGEYVVNTPGNFTLLLAYTYDTINGVYSVDVSNITEDCYIGISVYQDNLVEVDRVWVE